MNITIKTNVRQKRITIQEVCDKLNNLCNSPSPGFFYVGRNSIISHICANPVVNKLVAIITLWFCPLGEQLEGIYTAHGYDNSAIKIVFSTKNVNASNKVMTDFYNFICSIDKLSDVNIKID